MLLLPHQTKQVATESHKGTGLLSSFLTRKKSPPILFCFDGSPPGKEAVTLIFPPKCLKNKLELISDTAPLARHPMCPERGDEDAHAQVPRDLKLNSKQRMTKCQHRCGRDARIICRRCEAADVKVLQRTIANIASQSRERRNELPLRNIKPIQEFIKVKPQTTGNQEGAKTPHPHERKTFHG